MKSFLLKYQKPLFIGALLLLLMLFGVWIYKNITWEEVEIDRGYSKAALKNDFLAAELFLKKQGIPATSAKNFILLDKFSWRNTPLGDKDSIILINGHKTLTQVRYDNLMKWVENGGTLIASTHNPFIGDHTDARDLLLDDFEIEITPEEEDADDRSAMDKFTDELEKISKGNKPNKGKEFDDNNNKKKLQNEFDENIKETEGSNKEDSKVEEKEGAKKEKQKSEKYYRCNKSKLPTDINFYGEEKPLAFDFSQTSAFHHNGDDEIEVMHVVYFDIGKGSVTITSDNTIWENRRIDCYDHAYGLFRLINPEGRVWFLINQDAPSLWTILWRSATYGVIAALLTLCLWLWAKSQRFGPVLIREQLERRSLAEHIYASAMLLWRKQQHSQLVTLLRRDIMDRLHHYHVQVAQSSRAEQLTFLQQLTQISTNELQQALFAEDLLHPQAFTTAVACLQTIRKAL